MKSFLIFQAGNMYTKLSGDKRIAIVGNMTSAALRMLSIHSFLPPEVNGIIYGTDNDFSYVPVSLYVFCVFIIREFL